MKKIMRSLSLGILGAMLVTASPAMAAKAWQLPETGLKMESQAKQVYVAKEIGADHAIVLLWHVCTAQDYCGQILLPYG